MTALCACGCGTPAPLADRTDRARGYVKGQPRKFIHGHNGRWGANDWLLTDTGHETPCRLWLRSLNTDGYPMVHRDGYSGLAHRFFYEREVGPIPNGLDLDHLCRETSCVNPEHLEPVTRRENVWRSWEARYEGQEHSDMRAARLALRLSQRTFAGMLGVTQSTIGAWERGERSAPSDWRDRLGVN